MAIAGLIRAHWSDGIHEEWMRAVSPHRPDLERGKLERTRALMEAALPSANVDRFAEKTGGVISPLGLPDPDDEHIVEVALKAEASVIVTENVRDFPADLLSKYSLSAARPDELLLRLFFAAEEAIVAVVRQHRASLRKPRLTKAAYLATLDRSGLTGFVKAIRTRKVEV